MTRLKQKAKQTLIKARFFITKGQSYYANNLDIFTPTIWAKEAILQLQANMVIANLIHRDFENVLANYGDTVNVAKPGTFTMKRKGSALENVQIQDATAASSVFKLNQNPHVSFMIADAESAKSIIDLMATYLTPAVQAMAAGIDQIVGAQQTQFWGNDFAGHLGGMDSTNINDYLLDAREKLNLRNVPDALRFMVVGPRTETIGLKERMFVRVNESGSNEALRRANLGNLYNFDIYAAQNQPFVINKGIKTYTAAVNNAGGYLAGTSVLTVGTFVDNTALGVLAFPLGSWVVIAGDDAPRQITASSATSITLNKPIQYAVANAAAVKALAVGAVGNSTDGNAPFAGTVGNTPGWAKQIGYTLLAAAPTIGQPVTFGTTGTDVYTIIGVDTVNGQFTLDRPLVAAVASGAAINLGPVGHYNFAGQRNALALVVRPLPKPRVGALSSVVNYNGLSLRVTITYDGNKQGHLVTVDALMGVAALDANLGQVLLG